MTPEQLDMFERLESIQTRIAQLKAEEAILTAEIAAEFGVGSKVEHEGEQVAVIEQPMKFSAKQAQEVLSVAPALLKMVMVPSVTISAAQAKKVLPPETYEKCKVKNGNPKVKFVGGEE